MTALTTPRLTPPKGSSYDCAHPAAGTHPAKGGHRMTALTLPPGLTPSKVAVESPRSPRRQALSSQKVAIV